MQPLDLKAVLHPRIIEGCWKRFEDGSYLEAARWAGELMTKSLAEACGITEYQPPRRLVRKHVTVGDIASEQTLDEISKKMQGVRLALPAVKYQNEYEKEQAIKGAHSFLEGAFHYYRNFLTHNLVDLTKTECARAMVVSSEIMYLIETAEILIEGNYADGLTNLLGFENPEQTRCALEKIKGAVLFIDDIGDFLEEFGPYGIDRDRLRILTNSGMVSSETVVDDEQGIEVMVFDLTTLGLAVLEDKPLSTNGDGSPD
jgi:hypothetical protein